jgi:hypothetical protein
MRSKRVTYVLAIIVAMLFFVPFKEQSWAIYVAACTGYTVLVFGLRRLSKLKIPFRVPDVPKKMLLKNHLGFLIAVIAWVWLLIRLIPHLPYILRTEDTSHPYFGLIFIGVLGLMLLELYEQKWLRGQSADSRVQNISDAAK